jgi:hypothetical protein
VVRLARVSARAGYESSLARRLRQSHSADSATCECDHHNQHLREDGHAGRGRGDEEVGDEGSLVVPQPVPQLPSEGTQLGTKNGVITVQQAQPLEAVR